jgi:small-conductance mechanosensitive channel
MVADRSCLVKDQGGRTAGAHPADRAARASVERVSAALCAATGVCATTDATSQKLVAAVLRECVETVERTDAVDFDAETNEFRSAAGDIRLAVDRFPVDGALWNGVVATVALVGLVAAGASWAGVAGPAGLLVALAGLAGLAVGAVLRRAFRADVSVASRRD